MPTAFPAGLLEESFTAPPDFATAILFFAKHWRKQPIHTDAVCCRDCAPVCQRSTGRPGRTNLNCGRSMNLSEGGTAANETEKKMGLQNEKIAALSFVTADLNY